MTKRKRNAKGQFVKRKATKKKKAVKPDSLRGKWRQGVKEIKQLRREIRALKEYKKNQ